jgi:sec-independent protein translocase protein TatB
MFDIGFSELVLISIVALIVLGPERLPGAARTVGALLRRARASWATVRNEVERELAAEEIKRSVKETVAAVDPRDDIKAAADDIQSATSEVGKKLDERT